MRPHEAAVRIGGRADDRLAAHVERRVHEDRAARQPLESLNQVVVIRVGVSGDGLDARRVVDVRNRRNIRARHVELVDSPQPPLLVAHRDLALPLHGGDEQHVRGVAGELEVVVHPFAQHTGRERPEPFAELDLQIHLGLHARAARVTQDAARAQRPRTELHAPVEPAHDLVLGEQLRDTPQEASALEARGDRALRREVGRDLLRGELGAEIRTLHPVAAGHDGARLPAVAVPDQLRHAERPPCVAGSGLDPQPLEGALAQDAPVGHAVERDPTGEAKVLHPGLAVHRAAHAQHDLLAHDLDRAGQVHLALGQLGLQLTRRPSEQRVERAVGHRETGEIVEILLIEREGAVVAQVDQLA